MSNEKKRVLVVSGPSVLAWNLIAGVRSDLILDVYDLSGLQQEVLRNTDDAVCYDRIVFDFQYAFGATWDWVMILIDTQRLYGSERLIVVAINIQDQTAMHALRGLARSMHFQVIEHDDLLTLASVFGEVNTIPPLMTHRVVECDELRIDLTAKTATRGDNQPLNLEHRDFTVLEFLLTKAGLVVAWQELASHIFGHELRGKDRGRLQLVVNRLRKKLGLSKGQLIQNVHGCGYRFLPNSK